MDVLIHELIHQLFIQEGNVRRARRSWAAIGRCYRRESERTQIHIPLHAIHAFIYLALFGRKRLERDIRLIRSLPDYTTVVGYRAARRT